MTIVLTGGGSGGHITPILAVAAELKRLDPTLKLVYIGQTGDALSDVPAADPNIDAVYSVRAGKFRRYHGESVLKQLLDVKTVALNLRDAVYTVVGLLQSFWLLHRLRPSIVFSRGGFVSVPVTLGGRLNGVPYVTHDSDSIPSLANRLIARWADLHAVALPEEIYPYPIDKTIMVGIPVSQHYQPVTPELQAKFRRSLKLDRYKQILLVTGGGNGAERLNHQVVQNARYLLKHNPELAIVHLSGRKLVDSTIAAYKSVLTPEQFGRVEVLGFVSNLHAYSASADVIIARGSATNLAEFAIQAKPCVIIPAAQLVWTVENTKVMADRGAVEMLTNEQADQERRLATVINELLHNQGRRTELATQLASFARPDAAHHLATLLLERAKA